MEICVYEIRILKKLSNESLEAQKKAMDSAIHKCLDRLGWK